MRKALGAEKTSQLFQAVRSYKDTDNYENLVTTAVSLFTERDEDFNLLSSTFSQISACIHAPVNQRCLVRGAHCVRSVCSSGFGVIIRPYHKKQYKEMLAALTGQSVSAAAAGVAAVSEDQQRQGEAQPTVNI